MTPMPRQIGSSAGRNRSGVVPARPTSPCGNAGRHTGSRLWTRKRP
ncbi:MAG: hypothetical protein FI737_12990 [SAR202 cluster bacterium]|nr:hypothetical protein [SAR202 cluster bacterium]